MELCWGQYLDLEYQAGQPPSLKDYLNIVPLKTGTLVGACCEVAGKPASMINPSLLVFGERPGVLLQCQYDYLGGRGDPQVVGKTPTDVVERKRSLPVVLANQLWPRRSTPC